MANLRQAAVNHDFVKENLWGSDNTKFHIVMQPASVTFNYARSRDARRARQDVTSCESGGRGYAAGKRSGSRPLSACRQHPDRDGARSGPERLASTSPINRWLIADPGHQGPVWPKPSIAVKIVKGKADQVGFAVQPGRLVVERWISCNRRLMVDARPAVGLDGPARGPRFSRLRAGGIRRRFRW